MSARKPAEFIDHPDTFINNEFRAVGCYVVDGDTFDVLIDLGFLKYAYETIRLRGVNTPELKATNIEERFLAQQAKGMMDTLVIGASLRIKSYKDTQTFGRFVADVWTYDEVGKAWINVAEALINAGLGRAA